MKTKLFIIVLLFFSNTMFAQTSADLDINNIKVGLNAGGDIGSVEAPKGGGAHSIYAGNLWIGGFDAGNVLHVAAQTYRQTGNDFWPGPLDTINVVCPIAVSTSPQWNRVWKINQTTIDSFKLGLFQTVPQIILDWPGNGSGQQTHNLAPYYDMNGDGNVDLTDLSILAKLIE